MRIVFMGSDDIACPALDRLAQRRSDTIRAVVSQPPRPKGRKRAITPCPLHAQADKLGIETFTPPSINTEPSLDTLRGWAPDLIIVVAYGQILRKPILSLPRHGCVNLHASLLPKFRGAAPIQWAIACGSDTTGVSTMYMNEAMDAGDIILQAPVEIGPDDTAATLQPRLAEAGAALLDQTVDLIASGQAPRQPQQEANATYAPKLKKTDGHIDWHTNADAIRNRVRGFAPWPGCFCFIPKQPERPLKILRVHVEPGESAEPGTVLEIAETGLLVQTGTDAVRLLEVQPAGRRAMDGGAYACGHPLAVGDKLG